MKFIRTVRKSSFDANISFVAIQNRMLSFFKKRDSTVLKPEDKKLAWLCAAEDKVFVSGWWNVACLRHRTPHVDILFSFDDLIIRYKFDDAFADIGLYFAWVDCMEVGYGFTFELNGSVIFHDSMRWAPTFDEFAAASIKILREGNTAVLRFTETDDSRIEQYTYMMSFVRTEVFDYEEDIFFVDKEIKRRKSDGICYPRGYIEARLETIDVN